jgi:hypothetical protein
LHLWLILCTLTSDTISTGKEAIFTGLLVACAFDLEELAKVTVDESCQSVQCTNKMGQNPLLVAVRNGSCASLTVLLELDRNYIQITEEVVEAAAGNEYSGEQVMTLLLDRRGADIQITEEVVKAAAGNPDGGKVFRFLYMARSVEITDGVIESAASSGQETTLRLFDQLANTAIVAHHWILVSRLCAAAKKGDAKVVLQLAEQGVPVDKRDIRGTTPL